MEDARRQNSIPPGFTIRQVPRSMASKWSSSRAKCSTALLRTTSANESAKDIASRSVPRGSYRRGDGVRATPPNGAYRRPPWSRSPRRRPHSLHGEGRPGCVRTHTRHRARASRARCGLAGVDRRDKCRSGRIVREDQASWSGYLSRPTARAFAKPRWEICPVLIFSLPSVLERTVFFRTNFCLVGVERGLVDQHSAGGLQ